MTEEEDATTYTQLLRVVREAGLGWVADQVGAEVASGGLETVQVSPLQEETAFETSIPSWRGFQRQTGPKAIYLKSRPYSASERLRLLIDAIEYSVVRTAQMRSVVVATFGEQLAVNAITFAAPNENDDVKVYEAGDPEQLQAVDGLAAVLGRLRDQSLSS